MECIKGKTLVFTDLHLGLKSGSKSRLAICINAIKEILIYIKANNIQTLLFLGDWHHVRASTENNVLNVSYKLMSALAKHCKVYCILGNHDIYMKNTVDINSLVFFKNISNVTLLSDVTEISINGNRTVLVPWLGDMSKYEDETFDMMFGHFEASTKFLIKSYIEDHSNSTMTSEIISNELDNDNIIGSSSTSAIGNCVGNFITPLKKNGVIFSGHIHKRREFLAKGRKFVFIGDPYQQNLGEKDYECGFYIINEDNSYDFHEITTVPKHVEIRMSEVVNNYEKFNFNIVKGNILHKIYDIEVDPTMDAKISQRINDLQPYEELLPDYDVDISNNSETKTHNASIELIRKSKLDYIKAYIENIDKQILDEQQINAEKLYTILEEYYNTVADEK